MIVKFIVWIKLLYDRFFLRIKKCVIDLYLIFCVVKIKVLLILVGCCVRVEEIFLKWFYVRINEKICKIVVFDMY